MFVRFTESEYTMYRKQFLSPTVNTDIVQQVYLKVESGDGEYRNLYYLLKAIGNQTVNNEDYVTLYNDKIIFQHEDCPLFLQQNDIFDENGEEDNLCRALGYTWIHGSFVEEIIEENNLAYKFLLKK
jgi:hypothetical protein